MNPLYNMGTVDPFSRRNVGQHLLDRYLAHLDRVRGDLAVDVRVERLAEVAGGGEPGGVGGVDRGGRTQQGAIRDKSRRRRRQRPMNLSHAPGCANVHFAPTEMHDDSNGSIGKSPIAAAFDQRGAGRGAATEPAQPGAGVLLCAADSGQLLGSYRGGTRVS